MTKNGIDVSEWQGDIDWSAVTADFAIIRAGYGKERCYRDSAAEKKLLDVLKQLKDKEEENGH